jgi:hypothetical protein
MATSPYIHPLLYKSLLIGPASLETPGVVTLSGHDRKEKWEKQSPKGTTGTSTVNHGRDVVEFTASFFLADDEDRDGWDTILKFLQSMTSGPGGKPKAFFCIHPDLVSQGIIECVVTQIGGMTHDSKGGSTVAAKFLEYAPPKPKPASKATTAGVRQGKTVLDPNAAAKRELQLLLQQAKDPIE